MDMDIQNNSFLSIDQLANQYLNSSRKTVKAAQENLVSFQYKFIDRMHFTHTSA